MNPSDSGVLVSHDNVRMSKHEEYQPPDLKTQLSWILFTPVLCSSTANQNMIYVETCLPLAIKWLFALSIFKKCESCLRKVLSMLPCVQPQSMAEVLAKKEELADRLEKANEEAIASAIAEEEQLTREIQAENNDLETDNESDFSVRLIVPMYALNLIAFCFC